MQCMPQLEYKDYITQGGGPDSSCSPQGRVEGAWARWGAGLGICSENPTMRKNEYRKSIDTLTNMRKSQQARS